MCSRLVLIVTFRLDHGSIGFRMRGNLGTAASCDLLRSDIARRLGLHFESTLILGPRSFIMVDLRFESGRRTDFLYAGQVHVLTNRAVRGTPLSTCSASHGDVLCMAVMSAAA